MKPWELYDYLHNISYNSNVADYDWSVRICNEDKTIYVCTKYTTTILDWVENFLFFFIPQIRQWYLYFACLGWQTAFNSCKQLLMNQVLLAMNTFPDYKVVCCGHSYGGAGSVLAGIEIFFASGRKPDLITFGAPKPLFSFFTRCITRLFFEKVTQYAHKSDIVPYMPPLPGYWNVRVIRLGKFSFKGLFNPEKYHQIYGDESLYRELEI
ncbi:MAG: lipase family protein [Methanobrevibacter sp.]|nr:lipase family protein [Methanobrevibacter sp.]